MTQWVLAVPSAAFLAVFAAIAVLLVAKEIAMRSAAAKIGLNAAVGLALLCLTCLLVLTLMLPLHDLLNRIIGPQGLLLLSH
jgi:hypothetical protein